MEESKIMIAVSARTLRAIVDFANKEQIKRDDIVSLLKTGEEVTLIYYK